MSILAASGDIGGAMAIIPVLKYLSDCNEPFAIVEHGFLASKAPKTWKRVPAVLEGSGSLERFFKDDCFKEVVFTTSVKDTFPLKLARTAARQGVPVLCLLDNWMNYIYRLGIDGEPAFIPTVYMVMDDLAKAEAIREGVPESVLRVVGQPALGSLADDYQSWKKQDRAKYFESAGLDITKKLVVFISEPVSDDQGSGPENTQYRGYTEKTVLKELCARFQPFADKYQLWLVPHPRQDVDGLHKVWEQSRGVLEGGIFKVKNGRQAIFMADGVAGMVSILLYEAWLMNKPVISLQPGLCRPQLDIFRKRNGIFCVTKASEWDIVMTAWVCKIDKSSKFDSFRKDIELHIQAPYRAGKIIIDYLNNKRIKRRAL